MNCLNSIIIEGVVSFNEMTEKACRLFLDVSRNIKDENGEYVEVIHKFEVVANGSMAGVCHEKAKIGCGIRVVGRLTQVFFTEDKVEKSKTVITAEHIEFRKIK